MRAIAAASIIAMLALTGPAQGLAQASAAGRAPNPLTVPLMIILAGGLIYGLIELGRSGDPYPASP